MSCPSVTGSLTEAGLTDACGTLPEAVGRLTAYADGNKLERGSKRSANAKMKTQEQSVDRRITRRQDGTRKSIGLAIADVFFWSSESLYGPDREPQVHHSSDTREL